MTSLKDYVATFSKVNRLRFTYLKGKKNERVGVIISFVKDGNVMMGASKAALSKGDVFDSNYGIARAIESALPFNEFKVKAALNKLPNVPMATRSVRNAEGKVTGTEKYDQYETFIDRYLHSLKPRQKVKKAKVAVATRKPPRKAPPKVVNVVKAPVKKKKVKRRAVSRSK